MTDLQRRRLNNIIIGVILVVLIALGIIYPNPVTVIASNVWIAFVAYRAIFGGLKKDG